jgi:hypothetical protein
VDEVAEQPVAKKGKGNAKLLARIRKRAKAMMEADRDNRKKALDDLKFTYIPGEQWDELTKRERGSERPMYEFNKVRVTVKRIINDMRANRPMGKVRAAEDGDKPTANVLEGLIRNIWANSDGDTAIDYAAEYQVAAGMGAWRVTVDYADDEAFEQVIGVDPIRNPFCLYSDPSAQDFLKRDAEDWFLTDKISKASYESRWPNKEVVDFEADTEFDDDEDWQEEDEKVRIGEYWYKEPVSKELWLLSDGSTVDAGTVTDEQLAQANVQVLKKRQCKSHKIMMCIASGDSILEGPTEWAGKQFPFIQVYGEYVIIDGKVHWFGLTRFAKDAQRSYNYSRTNAIESIALAPQAKFWATAAQAADLTNSWAESHKKNYPFMLYNADPLADGPPQRMGGAEVPVALIQEMQMSSEDIKSVTGIYDASLGAQGNETSGKAINARQRQGEIATFNYMDNMAKGIRRTWEILVDLVPKIYDTPRSVRILGVDGAEDYAQINTMVADPQTGEQQAINDVARGKYDVAITVGPSFATLRQEAAEAYSEIASRDPNVMMAAGDLVFKAMDLPYAEQIAERYQAILPPPIQQMLTKGKQLPPEVQAAMAQVEQAQMMVDQKSQLMMQAEQELKALQAQAQGQQAQAKLASANLQTQEAQFQAQFDKIEMAKKDLDYAQQALANEKAIFDKHVENQLLKIKLAHAQVEHQLAEQAHHHDQQAMQTEHDLQNKQRDVQDTVKDGSQQLSEQQRSVQDAVKDGSQQLKDQQTQLDHKQALAKAQKPKNKA